MKKILVLVIALCLTLCLCGCEGLEKLEQIELPPLPTQTPAPTVPPTPEATAAPVESAEPVISSPSCTIIINTIRTALEEFDPAEGKELILSYSYETPVVFMEQRSQAAARINGSIALLDETHYTGNDHGMGSGTGGFNMMLEMAQDNFAYVYNTGAQGVSLEYTASRTAEIARADDTVLSIVYRDFYFTGGESGVHYTRGYSFDTESGEKLSLEKLSQDSQGFRSFLLESMKAQAADTKLTEDALAALLRDGSWYLGQDALYVFSDRQELAEEELVFRIPYEQLEGQLIDRLLPAKRSGEAVLSIRPLREVENGSVEILDRIVADESGEELCIEISGTAYDVRISSVNYTDRFYETERLWYASRMSDCAIQLLTVLPEGVPNRMVSYTDAQGVVHRLLISQSGEDGSVQLVSDEIEALG